MVVRAVAERPEYEIAGAFVYNPEKIGRDLGELCGIDPIGVKTTGDRQQIREAAADCVLFLAGAENDVPGSIDDICMLLASGKNVITTPPISFIPRPLGRELKSPFPPPANQGRPPSHALASFPASSAKPLLFCSP